jgi:hypothetical protein
LRGYSSSSFIELFIKILAVVCHQFNGFFGFKTARKTRLLENFIHFPRKVGPQSQFNISLKMARDKKENVEEVLKISDLKLSNGDESGKRKDYLGEHS